MKNLSTICEELNLQGYKVTIDERTNGLHLRECWSDALNGYSEYFTIVDSIILTKTISNTDILCNVQEVGFLDVYAVQHVDFLRSLNGLYCLNITKTQQDRFLRNLKAVIILNITDAEQPKDFLSSVVHIYKINVTNVALDKAFLSNAKYVEHLKTDTRQSIFFLVNTLNGVKIERVDKD